MRLIKLLFTCFHSRFSDVNADKGSSMKTSAAAKGTDSTVDEQDTMTLVGT